MGSQSKLRVVMESIEPDMVMGKHVVGPDGGAMGQIVDVGLFDHRQVKYLVVEDEHSAGMRRVPVKDISSLSATSVTVRAKA